MNPKEKIQKAKARLMLEHPYFGTIASSLKLERSDTVEAFLSDGGRLRYNEGYFEEAALEDVEFALANGAMHSVLKHRKRAGERHGKLWQLATDFAVNGMLLRNGLSLPDHANYQTRFEGMYAEEVYEILRSEIVDGESDDTEEQIRDGEDAEGVPDSHEPPGQAKGKEPPRGNDTDREKSEAGEPPEGEGEEELEPEADLETEERMAREFLEQLFDKMKRQGTLPKELKLLVPEYFSHRISWKEILYRYIADHAKSSFSFVPPNMKYLYRGIYLPSLSSDLLRIVVAIDSSGSIDGELLATFLGELQSITQQYPNYEIDLITADMKVQSHEVYLPGELLNYEIKGRGGTDFRPVFEYIDRFIDHPTLLLYFTDGMGHYPEDEPPYDLLWIMPERREVPFGEVVALREDDI